MGLRLLRLGLWIRTMDWVSARVCIGGVQFCIGSALKFLEQTDLCAHFSECHKPTTENLCGLWTKGIMHGQC